MKKLITFSLGIIFFYTCAIAQAPASIPYQAVVRNTAGNLLTNQQVSFRFTILSGSSTGANVYEETQTGSAITTNNLGLVTVQIGAGTQVGSNTFSSINWGNGTKYLTVEIDPQGAGNYVNMGTSQIMSVPYALYAASAGTAATGGTPQVNADWNATSGVAEILNKPAIPVFPPSGGTTTDYINGLGQPITLPTNVSTFTNDAGYLTASSIAGNYIQNGTGVQTGANFNVGGSGAIGTTLSVGSNATIGGTQTVTGATTLNAGLTETGNVNITGALVINDLSPSPLAALDIASTTQGFLPPRMNTTSRNAITAGMNATQMAAIQGLTIFNLDTGCIESFIGTNSTQSSNWQPVGCH